MNICVFVGPTLPDAKACGVLEAVYLPPAAQGDVYRAMLEQPKAIGIIDGYFNGVPAIWHKEVLWALSQGIAVYGSASMGALRAAELARFGMIGVGSIFEAYRDGFLQDDDEVAVTHLDGAHRYRPTSEAMVNIRSTLQAAVVAGIISSCTQISIESMARNLFYPERIYPALLRMAENEGLPHDELANFRNWLPTGRVDVKRADALAMLVAMRNAVAAGTAVSATCDFQHTVYWDRFLYSTLRSRSMISEGAANVLTTIVEELTVDPKRFLRVWRGALIRYFALNESARRDIAPTAEMIEWSSAEFRQKMGLRDPLLFERWLQDNGLNEEEFARLMAEEVQIALAHPLLKGNMLLHLANHLRITGEYAALVRRAAQKQAALVAAGFTPGHFSDVSVTQDTLLESFMERIASTLVDEPDAYTVLSALADQELAPLVQSLAREHRYLRLMVQED
jgi:hypothetical protein